MDSTVGYHSESRKAAFSNNKGSDCFWNSAPEELIAHIIAFLPCSNIYLAQGVCRRWRSIIWSPLFMLLCKQWSHPRKPWLLEFQHQMYNQAWAFDLDGWQWFHLNFSFLPENAIIVASSGGLVCLGRSSKEGYTLYICNPVTKKWRQLPSIPLRPAVVLLEVDHQSNTYKIAGLVFRGQCPSRPSGSVFIFDSKVGVWRETIGLPQELHYRNIQDASLCGKLLCCLTMCRKTETFDLIKAEWTQDAFTYLPNNAGAPSYIFNRAGCWGVVVPHRGPKGWSVFWYDVSARCWSSASPSPANSIVCAGRFSSFCTSAVHQGSEIYTLHAEGHKCYGAYPGSISPIPNSPLTRQKIQGRDILIRAVWFEPHASAMT